MDIINLARFQRSFWIRNRSI